MLVASAGSGCRYLTSTSRLLRMGETVNCDAKASMALDWAAVSSTAGVPFAAGPSAQRSALARQRKKP